MIQSYELVIFIVQKWNVYFKINAVIMDEKFTKINN